MPASPKEFPENQPKDEHGSPAPTPLQVREEAIKNRRAWEEEALYQRGFPVAGHDKERERDR